MRVNSGLFTASLASWADTVWPKIAGRFRHALLAQKRRSPSMLPQRRLPQPIRDLLWFVSIGAVVGAVYGHMIAIADGMPLLGFGGLPRGVLTGVVITGALFFLEQVWARPEMARLRRLPSFAVVLAIRFIDDINHLLGQNVLRNFITGYYHRPRLEERVFLFIDIEGSTALAERLGEFAFHRLINRFVVDITEPIAAAYGEIHRYVGDELIASWKLADGVADAHCVRACFDAFDRLAALSPVYMRDFGTPVHCRAGLHCGPVVTGEMGSVKKEIVFLGDTVNTTARIQEFCRQTGDRVLASAALVNLLELPSGITKRPLGDLRLRGKESDVVLYALQIQRADNTAAAA